MHLHFSELRLESIPYHRQFIEREREGGEREMGGEREREGERERVCV